VYQYKNARFAPCKMNKTGKKPFMVRFDISVRFNTIAAEEGAHALCHYSNQVLQLVSATEN